MPIAAVMTICSFAVIPACRESFLKKMPDVAGMTLKARRTPDRSPAVQEQEPE
jgi:hypothetical protein